MSSSSDNAQQLFSKPKSKSFVLDFFISEAKKNHSVDLFRSRILVGISLSIGFALFLGVVYIWLGSDMESKYQIIALNIIIPMSVSLFVITFAYKFTNAYVVCANSIVLAVYLGSCIGIYITGGPIASPVQFVITFPLVLSFCLLGKYWGLAWTAATFLTQIPMGKMALNSYDFPNLIEQGKADEVQILIYILTLLTTAAVLVIYEGMQSRLKTERDLQEQRFLFLATHDALTQLPNRVLFYDRAELAVSRANREGSTFAILYLDLNSFKPVNDDFGHEAGDHVLQIVAARLMLSIRETDVLARIGGDEFAVIVENLKSEESVDTIAQKIIKEIEKPIEYEDKEVTIGASIGVSFYPKDSKDIEVLISHADAAMYVAKNAKDHYIRFDSIESALEGKRENEISQA